MGLFGPCCLDKEQNETFAAGACCFSTYWGCFSAKSGSITARHWDLKSSREVRLVFFLWSIWKYNYYECTNSFCPFWLWQCNQNVARIFISNDSSCHLGFKSLSAWDHLQKTNGRPHYTFNSNCQLHKQNPYFPKRKLIQLPKSNPRPPPKNLTLFYGFHIYHNVLDAPLAPPSPSSAKPQEKIH